MLPWYGWKLSLENHVIFQRCLMKKLLTNLAKKVPYFGPLHAFRNNYYRHARHLPAHFNSPIPSMDDILKRKDQIWAGLKVDGIAGLDLHRDDQLALLAAFEQFYPEQPFRETKQEKLRYCFNNTFYTYTDAIILYSFIRKFRPKRIIEIGSGHSSSVMLDTRDVFKLQIQLTFIEPNPERLYSLISHADKHNEQILVSEVQDINLACFEALEANDILFVDSSHVSKTGSDLNFILFDVIPRLKKGVLIHFHDVFYPFEYLQSWVMARRNFNEDYLLRAFLMYNDSFKIRFFSHYLHTLHASAYKNMPLCYKEHGSDLWLEKTR
jgi:predicted O-methyltransferase YrrM